MNEHDALSLPAIMASQDARRGDFLGLSAVSLHRLLLVIPALCALAYPSLLSWLSAVLVLVHGSDSPNGPIIWVSVIGSLTLALAVMLVSFVFGLRLGSPQVGRPEDFRARCVALLAFATPSLYVGFANVGGVLRAPRLYRHEHADDDAARSWRWCCLLANNGMFRYLLRTPSRIRRRRYLGSS
jgi:hypothetical protein